MFLDESINAALQPWKEIIDQEGARVLGSTLVKLDRTNCFTQECTLGNFVTDAFVYQVSFYFLAYSLNLKDSYIFVFHLLIRYVYYLVPACVIIVWRIKEATELNHSLSIILNRKT